MMQGQSLWRWGDKVGALGALTAAMGCSMCFPVIATLGGALGLGFLSRWEGVLINWLLPGFAWLTLAAQLYGWWHHRQTLRFLLGIIGPILLLLSLYPWFKYAWSTGVTYGALGWMVGIAIWDIFWPANRRCDDSCQVEENA